MKGKEVNPGKVWRKRKKKHKKGGRIIISIGVGL
jgi:hypothetical protein